MATPTLVLTTNTPATIMAPSVVNVNIGLMTEINIRTSGYTWTAGGGAGEYYTDVSGLGGTLYNVRVFEKQSGQDLNTGFQWTLSAGGTTEYFLEASGGGDPGVWPFKTRQAGTKNGNYRLLDGGVAMGTGLPGDLSTNRMAWGDNPADDNGFNTFYARRTDSSDPDTATMTADYWPEMTEGSAVGSLNAGEFKYDDATDRLYVRLRDDADPDGKADGWLIFDYDLTTSGTTAGNDHHLSTVEWSITRSDGVLANWEARYREVSDPRRTAATISLATKDLRGYSVSLPLSAGTYTFTCKYINADGESASVSASPITVVANTRTKKTVGIGLDYADMPTAVATEGGNNDIEYELESGGSETLAVTISTITGTNAYIHVAGDTGTYTVALSNSEFLHCSAEGLFVDGVTLNPTKVETSTREVINFQGNHQGFANITIGGTYNGNRVKNAFFYDNDPKYCCIINCSVGATHSYSFVGQLSDFGVRDTTVVGNTFGDSTNESVIRTVGGAVRCSFLYNDCDESNIASKSALRTVQCYGLYIHGHLHTEADLRLGTITGASCELVRFDSCVSSMATNTTGHSISEGAFRVTVANNYLGTGNTAITSDSSPDSPIHDCAMICNTLQNNGTVNAQITTLFYVGGTLTDQAQVNNFKFMGNLGVLNPATSYSPRQARVRPSGLSINTQEFDQNVWMDPADFSNSDINEEGSASKTLAEWNALTYVGTDYIKSTTLDSEYLPASPQTITTPPGTYYDLWGNVRGASDVGGAVIATDPGPTAEPPAAVTASALSQRDRADFPDRLAIWKLGDRT
jgi:hypothetical protein